MSARPLARSPSPFGSTNLRAACEGVGERVRARPRPRRTLLLLLMLAVPFLSGCSLIFVDGPPEGHEQMAFTCTESRVLPTVDLLTSLAVLGLGVALVSSTEDDPLADDLLKGLGGMYLGAAAVGGFSAYKGFSRTSACRDAQRGVHERIFDALQQGIAEAGR